MTTRHNTLYRYFGVRNDFITPGKLRWRTTRSRHERVVYWIHGESISNLPNYIKILIYSDKLDITPFSPMITDTYSSQSPAANFAKSSSPVIFSLSPPNS